jgi:NAD(P)-dependent dehydrogenase (short-subunit alcohol dehydrogenase family)
MRSVVITGTSSGIGRATAIALASRGWRVFATMRDLTKRDLLAGELKKAEVPNGVAIEQLDVAS